MSDSEKQANEMVGRRHKVLAAAALWGACAWFLSLDVDFLITNLRKCSALAAALFMGVSVAIGYVIYRKYLLEIRTRGEKYAEIRVQIRRLLADLLTTPDEDLIRQLHRTTRHIEQVLKRYDPDAADLGGKLKSQMGVKHRPVCMRVSSRETLTPTQSAQEALDTEPGVEPPSAAGGNYRISSAATRIACRPVPI